MGALILLPELRPSSVTAETVLLLHAEDYTDSSLTPRTVQNFGSSITGSGKFGSAFDFSASGTSRVRALHSNSYNAVTNDFTVDFWVQWPVSVPNEFEQLVYRRSAETVGEVWRIAYENTFGAQQLIMSWAYSSAATQDAGAIFAFVPGQWYHLAFTREYVGVGTSWLRSFVNGNMVGSTQNNAHLSRNPLSGGDIYVGNDILTGSGLNGYIDEVRVVNGIAYWTSNFTPPTGPYI